MCSHTVIIQLECLLLLLISCAQKLQADLCLVPALEVLHKRFATAVEERSLLRKSAEQSREELGRTF